MTLSLTGFGFTEPTNLRFQFSSDEFWTFNLKMTLWSPLNTWFRFSNPKTYGFIILKWLRWILWILPSNHQKRFIYYLLINYFNLFIQVSTPWNIISKATNHEVSWNCAIKIPCTILKHLNVSTYVSAKKKTKIIVTNWHDAK